MAACTPFLRLGQRHFTPLHPWSCCESMQRTSIGDKPSQAFPHTHQDICCNGRPPSRRRVVLLSAPRSRRIPSHVGQANIAPPTADRAPLNSSVYLASIGTRKCGRAPLDVQLGAAPVASLGVVPGRSVSSPAACYRKHEQATYRMVLSVRCTGQEKQDKVKTCEPTTAPKIFDRKKGAHTKRIH